MKEYETRKDMLLQLLPKNQVICEIGVFAGDFAEWILKALMPKKLYAVDPYPGVIMCSGNQDGHNIEHYETKILGWFARTRTEIIPEFSADFLKTLSDGHLDAIYIDGDHSYEGVKADLELARHKVKAGGWIFGHDYRRHPTKGNPNVDCNCERAVNEFIEKYGLTLDCIANDGQISFGIKNTKKQLMFTTFSDRKELYQHTYANQKAYAAKQSLGWLPLHSLADWKLPAHDRHPSWNKILMLIDIITKSVDLPNKHEYICWIDDDIIFTNTNKTIYDFIDESGFRESAANVLVCEDPDTVSTLMNCGMMIIKNNLHSKALLEVIWNLGDKNSIIKKQCSYEQEAFNFYYKFIRRSDIMILPVCTLQSSARYFDVLPGRGWRPGHFTAHLNCGELSARLQTLKLISKVIQ